MKTTNTVRVTTYELADIRNAIMKEANYWYDRAQASGNKKEHDIADYYYKLRENLIGADIIVVK